MPRTKKAATPRPKKKDTTLKGLRAELEKARDGEARAIAVSIEQRQRYVGMLSSQSNNLNSARGAIARSHEMFEIAATQFGVIAMSLSLLGRLAREAETKAAKAVGAPRKVWFAKSETPTTFDELRESLSLIGRLIEEGQGRARNFETAFAAAKNPDGGPRA